MTYKKIVEELIRAKANKWVRELLEENGIEYRFVTVGNAEMENDKERDTIFWHVPVEVVKEDYHHVSLTVGGTADDTCGICRSVIYRGSSLNVIWMEVEETREQLGIEEFKIA